MNERPSSRSGYNVAMLLPYLSLDAVSEEPESVRAFLSKLSRISNIGIVEALRLDHKSSVIRAHADRYSFTILLSEEGKQIVENIGPQTVRLWQRDHPDDISNAFEVMGKRFGDHVENLDSLRYLYTEHAWFIWRAHRDAFLPRVKRRAFHFSDFSMAVLHSKQNDIRGGERLEYVLELPHRLLRYTSLHLDDGQGQFKSVLDEDTHDVHCVGF
jgi:hypothetical protein